MSSSVFHRRWRRTTIVGSSWASVWIAWSTCAFAAGEQRPEEPQSSTVLVADSEANSEGLSLDEVLRYAEAHAPLLKSAEARTRLASAAVTQESPWFPENPQVSGSLGTLTQNGGTGVQYALSLSQEIEIAGERGMRKRAALAEEKLGHLSQDVAHWELHVEVHRLHNELILMAEKRRQAERFVAFSESLQKIADGQVRAGETAPLTLLVADTDLAQTRSELLATEQQEAATKTVLGGLIGWPRGKSLSVSGDLPKTQPAPEVSRLLQLMADNHPSLQLRREAVNARQARLASEQRDVWPNPTVGASFARQPELPGQPRADSIMFQLSVPLPLWRRNQGGIAKAQAELDLAASQQAEVTTQLETQLQVTASALNAAAARVAIYESSIIPKLEEKLVSLQRAYELGEVGLLQVSQTRERLLEGSQQYLDARIAYFRAAAALEGYVGIDLTSSAARANSAASSEGTRK